MTTAVPESALTKDQWNRFILSSATGSVLQSWEWGEFQTAAGFSVRHIVLPQSTDSTAWRAASLAVEHPLPFGRHSLYLPYGPVLAPSHETQPKEWEETLTELTRFIRVTYRSALPIYIRIEPHIAPSTELHDALHRAHATPLGRGVQPMDSLVLDLKGTDDELLRAMRPKTRYNIRIAMRHGVTVTEETHEDGLSVFLALAKEVQEKGAFHYHADAYYQAMLRTLGGTMLSIRVARHNGLPIAAAIFFRFGTTVTYAHGASSHRHAHVMGSYLLHWDTIQKEKARGATAYDFFGIGPSSASTHPWAGITKFKKGFGGRETHATGIADIVLDPVQYRIYSLARGFRSMLNT